MTIYKYSAEPPAAVVAAAGASVGRQLLTDNPPRVSELPLEIPIDVPDGATRLKVTIWSRFGRLVRRLLDEADPAPGSRTIEWDGVDDAGQLLGEGQYLLQFSVDDSAESQIVHVSPS